jgi:transaldolase
MPKNTETPLQRLAELGQSVWIDYLSRELLESGELARLVREDAVVGVTSNPTIFQQALAHGDEEWAQLDTEAQRVADASVAFAKPAPIRTRPTRSTTCTRTSREAVATAKRKLDKEETRWA